MLGISYGELFLLLGATAALIGPKDLPVIARTAGRFAGRAIAYVQLARGQFDSVMQQSQARQVHKELQDAVAQLEAIRYEIRSVSFMNPGPMTRRLVDNIDNTVTTANRSTEALLKNESTESSDFAKPQESTKLPSELSNLHSQATTFARLAESSTLKSAEGNIKEDIKLDEEDGFPTVLPVSAETAGLLPNRKGGDVQGSDILLEAVVESEVAHNAKAFFSQPENQIKQE